MTKDSKFIIILGILLFMIPFFILWELNIHTITFPTRCSNARANYTSDENMCVYQGCHVGCIYYKELVDEGYRNETN